LAGGRLAATGCAGGAGCGVSDADAGSSFFVDRRFVVVVDRLGDLRAAGFFSSGI
jgi:hypothetical protein